MHRIALNLSLRLTHPKPTPRSVSKFQSLQPVVHTACRCYSTRTFSLLKKTGFWPPCWMEVEVYAHQMDLFCEYGAGRFDELHSRMESGDGSDQRHSDGPERRGVTWLGNHCDAN